jgi:guanylate kinase
VEYYFFSADEFRQMIAEEKFVEYEEVYAGSFYGTLKSEVERIWAKGNTIIFDIDVQGGVNLKRIFGDQALSVFIQAPSVEVLRERLIGRGTDTMEAIEKRVAKAASEMEFAAGKFDYTLINDDLQTALAEAEKVVGGFLAE